MTHTHARARTFRSLSILTLCLAPLGLVQPALGEAAFTNSLYVLTTPDGANMPASASETNFPLLVRLSTDFFDFSQAKTNGADIRFATSTGSNLAYQIEEWSSNSGTASIWVKIPVVKGNTNQEIKMFWGSADSTNESSGRAVFSAANGYASVIHMSETLKDEVGLASPANIGTTLATGMIGKGRHFTPGVGVNCGTGITNYPTGSTPHSSEVWFRADAANNTLVGWGIEQGQGKVVMQLANPPHINMDCYFSGGNVSGGSTLPLSQWIHVARNSLNEPAKPVERITAFMSSMIRSTSAQPVLCTCSGVTSSVVNLRTQCS